MITAPELPATTLAMGCYSGMFADCRKLAAPPKLLATTLAPWCYNGMFIGTTIKQIDLPAKNFLHRSCYFWMFNLNNAIKIIKLSLNDVPNKEYLDDFTDILMSHKGVLIRPSEDNLKLEGDLLRLPNEWIIVKEEENVYKNRYLAFTVLTEGTITFTGEHGVAAFSVDEGENWSTLESSFTL